MKWCYLMIILLIWTGLGIWGMHLIWKHLQTTKDPRERKLAKSRIQVTQIFIRQLLFFPPRFFWGMRGLFSNYLPRVLHHHSTLTIAEAKIIIALPTRALAIGGALVALLYLVNFPVGIVDIILIFVGTFIISIIHAFTFDVPNNRSK
jgi:hypothetical protein